VSSSGPSDWNRAVIEEFRANAGRVGGTFAGNPMVLLHHIGARSGTERISPLVYAPDGQDLVIAATKGGSPTNPDWYHNLMAHPRVQAEVDSRTLTVQASEVTGPERDELWRRIVAVRPSMGEYETKTDRVFPIVRLTPVPDEDPAADGPER
jgi:deazaflavin-dependent oxidoreductase (nitroreductase family)